MKITINLTSADKVKVLGNFISKPDSKYPDKVTTIDCRRF